MKNKNDNSEAKKKAGYYAADLIKNNTVVGIGTGSTVAFFIEALGKRIKNEKLNIKGVVTSFQSGIMASNAGIDLLAAENVDSIDITVDGADEIDKNLNAIKGGGAAQTKEKIVAQMSKEFVLIVDKSKLKEKLCTKFCVPIEIIQDSYSYLKKEFEDRYNCIAKLRMGQNKDGPVITDNGHFVLDIFFDIPLDNPKEINDSLRSYAGVIETGLFISMATQVVYCEDDEIKIKSR